MTEKLSSRLNENKYTDPQPDNIQSEMSEYLALNRIKYLASELRSPQKRRQRV